MKPASTNPIDILAFQSWCHILSIIGRLVSSSDYQNGYANSEISPMPIADKSFDQASLTALVRDNLFSLHHSGMKSSIFLHDRSKVSIQASTAAINNIFAGAEASPNSNYASNHSPCSPNPSQSHVNKHRSLYLSTYDEFSGACDLCFCYLVKHFSSSSHSDVLLASDMGSGDVLGNQVDLSTFHYIKSKSRKKCLVFISKHNNGVDLTTFSMLLEETAKYYDVIVLPLSLETRTQDFRIHYEFLNVLSKDITTLAVLPSLSDLVKISCIPGCIFISDAPHAGWLFSSLGMNAVLLSTSRYVESIAFSNGYCQGLEVPIVGNILENIRRIENLGGIRSNVLTQICKLHSRKLLRELVVILESLQDVRY